MMSVTVDMDSDSSSDEDEEEPTPVRKHKGELHHPFQLKRTPTTVFGMSASVNQLGCWLNGIRSTVLARCLTLQCQCASCCDTSAVPKRGMQLPVAFDLLYDPQMLAGGL